MMEEKKKTEEQLQPPSGQGVNNMFYKATPLIFEKAKELRSRPTPAEEFLWNYLGQLDVTFRRQHPASLYVLDFYAHKIKLAIEIDGSIHEMEDVKRNDIERQTHLESLGINFLRFTNQQVLTQIEFVLEKIKNEIENRLASPLGAGGIEIIPAIDLIEGKCVRLAQGDYLQKKIYNENPFDVAMEFEDAGIKRLHLVDLDGAKKGTIVNQRVLEAIAKKTKLIIDFGGGIKTDVDIQSVFSAGAAIATIGSIAVKNTELFFGWVKKYGPEKILLGADVKNEKIAVSGWTEQTTISVFDFIQKNMEQGVKNIFCTDISKDGMLEGTSTELYKSIIEKFPKINLVASGGVASMKDIEEVERIGCKGVIIGKAIYEGRIKLNDLKDYLC